MEIKVMAKGDPIPLDLLICSKLVQQELTRLDINSTTLLNKTVNVAPGCHAKTPRSADREVEGQDHE